MGTRTGSQTDTRYDRAGHHSAITPTPLIDATEICCPTAGRHYSSNPGQERISVSLPEVTCR
jgi:hypothetical protein